MAGDDTTARGRYAATRLHWERIEKGLWAPGAGANGGVAYTADASDLGTDSPWMTAGSYLVAPRTRMAIETWDRTSLREQETLVGRTTGEGAPLSGGTELTELTELTEADLAETGRGDVPLLTASSHVRLAHPSTNGGVRMFRRGDNFIDGNDSLGRLDAGLCFIADVRDPRTHYIPMQTTLLRDDALMEQLLHAGSGLFAVPPGRPGGAARSRRDSRDRTRRVVRGPGGVRLGVAAPRSRPRGTVTAVTSMSDGSTRPTAPPRIPLSARTRALSRAAVRARAMRTDTTTPPDAGTATRVSLVAVLTVLTHEMVRASGPLLDGAPLGGPAGAAPIGVFALAGAAAALLLLTTGRRFTGSPDGRTVLAGTVAVAVARLVAQCLDGAARVVVGLVTVALAVGILTLTVSFVAGRATGGRQAALGLVLGSGLATGLQLSLGTWDAFWRHGPVGWVVVVVLTVGAVALAHILRTDGSTGRPRRLWMLGPYLALATMVFANPAFVANQTGEPLRDVGPALVVAHVVAVWLLLSPHLLTGIVRGAAALAIPVAALGALVLTGGVELVAVVVLQLAVGVALATGLTTHRVAPLGVPGTALAVGVVGLGLAVLLLVSRTDIDVPLGLHDEAVALAGGLALAVAGLRRRVPAAPVTAGSMDAPATPVEPAQPFRSNAIRMLVTPAVALAVVGWWPTSAAASGPALARGDSLVVVDWNLHYGVAPSADVDPERIARTIEAQDPDVVTIQEVSRGWVLGGGLDLTTWLSHRLGMHVVVAPAGDRQLGTAILARSALTDPVVTPLPSGAGSQRSSAVSATLTLASGTAVRVTSVELQGRADSTPPTLDGLHALLAALGADGPAVLAGGLFAEPGSPAADVLRAAGWTNAFDPAGGPAPTYPSDNPQSRVDVVLAQALRATHTEVPTTPRSSDHLPVVVTLQPIG